MGIRLYQAQYDLNWSLLSIVLCIRIITTHIITDNVILMVLIIDFAQYMQEKKNCISYHGKHKCNYKMTTWLTFVKSLLHSYQFDVYIWFVSMLS